MAKAIYLDLDGCVCNLYGVKNWLPMLIAENPYPYAAAAPMYDMVALNTLLFELKQHGYTIGVISWTAKNGSKEYNKVVKHVKRKWIAKHLPVVTEINIVEYGTPKHNVAKIKNSILVDDEFSNRANWSNGETIDANGDIIAALRELLNRL